MLESIWRQFRKPRPFQAYCVSLGKSGTHSIAGLCSSHYRAKHEPGVKDLINVLLAHEAGKITFAAKKQFFIERDGRMDLALESSTVLINYIDVILNVYPEAKFIVTIRDCYSWLNSALNHAFFRGIRKEWQDYNDFFYGPEKYRYSIEKKLFSEKKLYSLDSHLAVWAKHNNMALSLIPSDRLLMIRLKDISKSVGNLAKFLGVPEETINLNRSHKFKAVNDAGLLYRIDRDFLEERVKFHCHEIMQRFYPEIKGLEDAVSLKQ
jgi:hypothetical protein